MELEIKRPDLIVPSYSLTGDLLSYMRCRLQYRYHSGSALPPSRPVQQWFGEFLHGTLELAFRFWEIHHKDYPFPWPCTQREWTEPEPDWAENDIGRFANKIENSLKQQGKSPRSSNARNSGYHRVQTAINILGPHLFMLITAAEEKVIGTRNVPASFDYELRCRNYQVHGIIDVLTSMRLGNADSSNLIRKCVENKCPNLNGPFEVILDYKGSKRPNTDDPFWKQGEWQIQTYSWLRSRQSNALKVAAGILIYINELSPSDEEMRNLQRAIQSGTTDEIPKLGSSDERIVRMWKKGESTDELSWEFRLRRAIRVISVTESSSNNALMTFDNVVKSIEEDIVKEASVGNILEAWNPDCKDENTCSACDFRRFCPRPARKPPNYQIRAPKAP